VHSEFENINAYVYHSAHGMFLDAMIWGLGPYVDDDRPYGMFRIYLARLTRVAARWWYRVDD